MGRAPWSYEVDLGDRVSDATSRFERADFRRADEACLGADPEAALRPAIEEAGLDAGQLDLLGEIYPSPGMTDSVTSVSPATWSASTATWGW